MNLKKEPKWFLGRSGADLYDVGGFLAGRNFDIFKIASKSNPCAPESA